MCYVSHCTDTRWKLELSRDIRVNDIRVRAMGRACLYKPTLMVTPTTNPPVSAKVNLKAILVCAHTYVL